MPLARKRKWLQAANSRANRKCRYICRAGEPQSYERQHLFIVVRKHVS